MLEKGGDFLESNNPLFCKVIILTLVGWRFATSDENVPGDNVTPDPHHPDFTHLRQIYFEVDPEYKGRFTVPTLYDYKQGKIVNNEVFSTRISQIE